jgi:hypothetical protein
MRDYWALRAGRGDRCESRCLATRVGDLLLVEHPDAEHDDAKQHHQE